MCCSVLCSPAHLLKQIFRDRAHRESLLSSVICLQGWLWVNEAQVEMNHSPRWGYIAATPGKVLGLKVLDAFHVTPSYASFWMQAP